MMNAWRLTLALTVLGAPLAADVTGPGGKTQACYCTDQRGARIELGEMICLRVDGTLFMAQCQMSLNVPMWRKVQDGCLGASLSHPIQPRIDTGLVHPKI